MATEAQFTVLLWEVGIGIAVEIGVLIAILLMVHKSSTKMNTIADDLHKRTVPILDSTNTLVATLKPQLESIVANLSESSEKLRNQVDDIVDRTRLQVLRADELVSRTMDKVEETTEMVQHSVISPVRQIAGLLQGLTVGMNVLFGRHGHNGSGNGHRQPSAGASRDEMFI